VGRRVSGRAGHERSYEPSWKVLAGERVTGSGNVETERVSEILEVTYPWGHKVRGMVSCSCWP